MISKKEKYEEKMSLLSKSFSEILKEEVNLMINNIENNPHNLTNWLEVKLNYVFKAQVFWNEQQNRIKVYSNKKIQGIFNNKKYNLVIEDTVSKKILCVINIQKILYNINNNFYNVFKDTVLNNISLDWRNIPLYTIVIVPAKWYNKNNNWAFWEQEIFNENNILRLYNANNYSKIKSNMKLLLMNNEIRELPISKNVDVLTSASEIVLLKWKDEQKKELFENKIMIKSLNNIFSDIYNIIK